MLVTGGAGWVRDWLHVLDHCRGIEHVLDSSRAGISYNIDGWEPANLEVMQVPRDLVDETFAGNASLCNRFPAAPHKAW